MEEPHKIIVLRWLLESRTITQKEANDYWKCQRLAARIFDLKKDGWHIEKDMVGPKGRKFAEYRLAKSHFDTVK